MENTAKDKGGWRLNCQCDDTRQSWVEKRKSPKASPVMFLLLTEVPRRASQLAQKTLYRRKHRMAMILSLKQCASFSSPINISIRTHHAFYRDTFLDVFTAVGKINLMTCHQLKWNLIECINNLKNITFLTFANNCD